MAASAETDAMISGEEETEEYNWIGMQENVYSAGISSVIQQIDAKVQGKGADNMKGAVRIMIALAVIVLAIGLQVFLVVKVKTLVCAKSVHGIRETYSIYQDHMYSEKEETINGKYRGIGEMDGDFDTLDDDVKEEVCQFPLSQPDFLFAILFMWSMTIVAEVRRCIFWARRFIIYTETDLEGPCHVIHPEGLPEGAPERFGLEDGTTGLKSLSKTLKAVIAIIFAVQTSTALFLLWVGCRWLTASPNFADLILNGLALTFIVEIKDMLYADLLPTLLRSETEIIRVRAEPVERKWIGMDSMLAPVFWAMVSALWCWLYLFHLQAVLPQYKWDVKGPCYKFLTEVLTKV